MDQVPGGRLVAVVVPAHDEEALLGRCLTALHASAAHLERAHGTSVTCRVVVALDRCTDGTAAIAAAAGVRTVESVAPGVGAARRSGVDHVVAHLEGRPAQRVWLAHTDADTVVPADWLAQQVDVMERGGRLVTGAVLPDALDLAPGLMAEWVRRHHPAAPVGTHVHGANLGVRLDAYLAVGGFRPDLEHEDQRLVARLVAAGVAPHAGTVVVTAGRLHGRVERGFSGYLRDLRDARLRGTTPTPGGLPGAVPQ